MQSDSLCNPPPTWFHPRSGAPIHPRRSSSAARTPSQIPSPARSSCTGWSSEQRNRSMKTQLPSTFGCSSGFLSKIGKGPPGAGYPPENSRRRKHNVVCQPRSVSDSGKDVIGFKKRIVRQNLLVTRAVAQKVKHVRDAHPFATDAGLSATLAWLHGNPFHQFHSFTIPHHRADNTAKRR